MPGLSFAISMKNSVGHHVAEDPGSFLGAPART